MKDLGIVQPGSTLYIEFDTFNSSGASVTLTGLAVTDVEVYKDGGTTQRASDNGYTLLDTDGIDFDGVTGIHGLSIDLADNSTAGFWAAGSHYRVVISSVTIDSQTVTFTAATFRIGYPAAVLNTTIATLSTQTSFTLTVGPAEDDALNGTWAVIHDVASAVQKAVVQILDYTGATKTVTLAAGATFTAAATDNISVMGPMPLQPATTGRSLNVGASGHALADLDTVKTQTVTCAGGVTIPAATLASTTNITAAAGVALSSTGLNLVLPAEPGGAPGWTATIVQWVAWMGSLARNKVTQTSTTQTLRNDADNANISTSTHSDDGTTHTRGEWT